MARQPRIDYPGAKHHVMNRGNRHGAVFYNEECCLKFLDLVGLAVRRYGITVHAYVLMPNHYHLLVESVHGNLSAAMKLVSQEYTQYLNRTPGFDGSVFRGRFANKLVEDETHWHYLPIYLHLNPVRAGVVMNLDDYPWSSHAAYLGETTFPEWLDTSDVMSGFGNVTGYLEYLNTSLNDEDAVPPGFEAVLFERRASKTAILGSSSESGRITPDQAIADVCNITGASSEQLKTGVRGRTGNAPRALALWWLVHGSGMPVANAAKMLGLSYGAATRIMSRLRGRGSGFKDPRLVEWQCALEK